jgi:uncharacterized protein (DUF1778 family)
MSIQRPSTKPAARALASLEREEKRVTFRATKRTQWALRAAATAKQQSVKAFLLTLAKGAGADIDPADLDGKE